MIGFLTGVAVNIVFGQIADLCGVETTGRASTSLKAFHVLTHPSAIDVASLCDRAGRDRRPGGAQPHPVRRASVRSSRWSSPRSSSCSSAPTAWRGCRTSGEDPARLPAAARPGPRRVSGSACVTGGARRRRHRVGAGRRRPRVGPQPRQPVRRQHRLRRAGHRQHRVRRSSGASRSAGRWGETALNVTGGGREPVGERSSRASGCCSSSCSSAGSVGKVAMPTLAGDPDLRGDQLAATRPGPDDHADRADLQVAVVATFIATLALPDRGRGRCRAWRCR